MKTSAIALLLTTIAIPILAAPIPTSQNTELQNCGASASCKPSFKEIVRAWHSKHSITENPFKDLERGLASKPHFPASQLSPKPSLGHVEVEIISTPNAAVMTKEEKEGSRLPPSPNAEKVSATRTPELPGNPALEAALKVTHEYTAKSVQAAAMLLEEIRKNEELREDKDKVTLQPTQTNRLPIPTSALLKASSKTATPECCMENADLEDIIAKDKRFGLTSWIKSNCATLRDGETVTYTYSYVKRDYTDVLVVGLVMIFLIAVVVIELLQKLVDTSKDFFGIKSQPEVERDCECGREILPPYSSHDIKMQPAPRSPTSVLEQWVDEKTEKASVTEAIQDW